MICKLVVVQKPDKTRATKKQIFIRYSVATLRHIVLPICLYILNTNLIGIPLFISALIICFTRDNISFHDYFSHTKVINKSRSNAFEVLESMKEMTEQQAMNTPNSYK